MNKINNPIANERVQSIQTNTLNGMLDGARLYRMILSASRFGAANVYTFDELLEDTKKAVWSELSTNKPFDVYRRNLQKSYVERLGSLLNPAPAQGIQSFGFGGTPSLDVKKSDILSYLKGHSKELKASIDAVAGTAADKSTKYHLQDLSDRLKKILDPK